MVLIIIAAPLLCTDVFVSSHFNLIQAGLPLDFPLSSFKIEIICLTHLMYILCQPVAVTVLKIQTHLSLESPRSKELHLNMSLLRGCCQKSF